MKAGPHFRYLALATLVGIFALSVLGGVVRITDSGLGCPDWPLCHGQIIPPFDAATLIEYSHRLVASVVGLMVLATVVVAWRRYRSRPWIFRASLFGLVMVIGQSILGGAAVLTELETWVVMIHMGMAQALVACYVLICIDAWRGFSVSAGPIDGRVLILGAAAFGVYLLILTGTYVALTGASGACNQWPLCQGGKLWVVSELPLIHFAHRVGTVLVVGLLAAAVWAAWRTAVATGCEDYDGPRRRVLRVADAVGRPDGMVGPADGPAGPTRRLRYPHLGRPGRRRPPAHHNLG